MYEYGGFSWRRAPGFLGISELVGLHISGSRLVSCDRLLAPIGNTADLAADEFGCTTTVCSCWCRPESDSFFMASRMLSAHVSRGIDGTITLWSIEFESRSFAGRQSSIAANILHAIYPSTEIFDGGGGAASRWSIRMHCDSNGVILFSAQRCVSRSQVDTKRWKLRSRKNRNRDQNAVISAEQRTRAENLSCHQ